MQAGPIAIEFIFHPEDAGRPSENESALELFAKTTEDRLQGNYAVTFPQLEQEEDAGSLRQPSRILKVVLVGQAFLAGGDFEIAADRQNTKIGDNQLPQSMIALAMGDQIPAVLVEKVLGQEPFGFVHIYDEHGLTAAAVARHVEHAIKARPIWMCIYNPEKAQTFGDRIDPGNREQWRINPFGSNTLQTEMAIGDTVAIWRSNPEKMPSGFVALAEISDMSALDVEEDKEALIEFKINLAFPDEPYPREQFLKQLGKVDPSWPQANSLRRLNEVEARAFRGLFDPAPPPPELRPAPPTSYTRFSSDQPEIETDLLSRAPLAFTLAHKINEIWGEQNKDAIAQKGGKLRQMLHRLNHKEKADRPAFTLHIDAPWGGGKTTFANYISRFLNPSSFGFNTHRLRELQAEPQSIFHKIPMRDEVSWPKEFASRKWISVPFNAWRHQHVSPPWWDLYEVIRLECTKAQPLHRRVRMRTVEFFWRAFPPERIRTIFVFIALLALFYFMLTREPVQIALSLQEPANPNDTVGPLDALLTAITGVSGLAVLTSFGRGIQELIRTTGQSINKTALGESDPLRRFRCHFAALLRKTEHPVIVVVDDLDRCEAGYVVELVRGMLTVFQSPRLIFVLLGDRAWIETAFSKVYTDMKTAEDDSATFGKRFVEKAIQVSYVLPKADDTLRGHYLDGLLFGPAGKPKSETPSGMNGVPNGGGRNTVKPMSSNDDDDVQPATNDQIETQKENIGLEERIIEVVRAAADRGALEDETKHVLSALRDYLPNNPRQIKRIINMITLYQASAMTVLGARVQGEDWYRLIPWVLLMSEHPEHWRLLCEKPALIEPAKLAIDKLPKDDHPDRKALEKFTNEKVSKLINGQVFKGQSIQFDEDQIARFKRLTPLS